MLTACNGIFDDIYDEPAIPAAGDIYVDASDWTQWHYIDLHALKEAADKGEKPELELHISAWGRNIRYALATVIVFWTFVEIMARNGFFNEIWVDPMNHVREMTIILAVFIIVVFLTIFSSKYITTEE